MSTAATVELEAWLQTLLDQVKDLPLADHASLGAERKRAVNQFLELGWPTRKLERWHYSDLKPIRSGDWVANRDALPTSGEVESCLLRLPGGGQFHRLVFLNGELQTPFSELHDLPQGVLVGTVADLLAQKPELATRAEASDLSLDADGMQALNTALWTGGYGIYVPKGVKVERPIEAIFITTQSAANTATFLRNIVVAEEQASVDVVDVFTGSQDSEYLVSSTTDLFAEPASRMRHVRLQEDGHRSHHLGQSRLLQSRDSEVTTHQVTTGARVSRHDLSVLLSEPGARCSMNGLFVLNGQQKADHQTLVDHKSPHTESNEYYKGVLDGASTGSFTGRVLVRKDSQRINATQENPNLLLSDLARINTRPQLEIYADDVQCSHGATSGRLDANAMFYLRSRGLSRPRARQILTRAFIAEVIESIPIQAVQDHLLPLLDDRLCPGHLLEESS